MFYPPARKPNFATLGLQCTRQYLDQCRLSGTVFCDEGMNFACLKIQRNALQPSPSTSMLGRPKALASVISTSLYPGPLSEL